jgi:alkylation response protein AidB-like acyl-CoA dehydrogenase
MVPQPVQNRNYAAAAAAPTLARMTATLNPPLTEPAILALAAEIGRLAAATEATHDRDASFVAEAYDAMAERGYLALAVPTELGGGGAGLREVVLAELELGRHSGPAALAAAMHLYLSLVQCWRLRRGAPDAEAALRRVATDRMIMATSGGSDWVCPTTTAVAVEGGFRFTGRKKFCSQAPVATVLATSATLGEPGPGAEVLHASVPFASPGVSIVETWDTLGMRGTASHDVVLDRVFVPADKITGRRPYGELTGPLLVAAIHFAPVVAAAYLGIAFGAFDIAQRTLRERATPSPAAARILGEMRARLRVGRWGLLAAVDELGDDPAADEATLATVMTAKRHAVLESRAVVDLAMDAVGGAAFFRSSPLEQAYRDVRGGPFHPLTPEATLALLGEIELRPVG